MILEVAARRYPESLDFKSYLANVYSDTYETWNKAQKYANEVLSVNCDKDGHFHTECKDVDGDQLAACFSAYIGVGRYDIIIDIGEELLDKVPRHRGLILRSLSTAYRQNNQPDEEARILQMLIADYPMNDINHYRLASYYLRKSNYIQAYYQIELASAIDLSDTDYMFIIAGIIIDRKIAYTAGSVKANLSLEESINLAIPFIYQAFSIDHSRVTLQRCQDFLLRNRLRAQAEDFAKYTHTNSLPEELNFEALEHVKKLSENLQEEYCKLVEIS